MICCSRYCWPRSSWRRRIGTEEGWKEGWEEERGTGTKRGKKLDWNTFSFMADYAAEGTKYWLSFIFGKFWNKSCFTFFFLYLINLDKICLVLCCLFICYYVQRVSDFEIFFCFRICNVGYGGKGKNGRVRISYCNSFSRYILNQLLLLKKSCNG